jgi:GTP-binding protein Era
MNKKAGFAAILGKPNAGKSTLMNAILGQSLSIVTPKAQTTRNKIFGIYTQNDAQVIFVDTPGILDPKYKLQIWMRKEIESVFNEADIVVLVIDANKYEPSEIEEVFKIYGDRFAERKLFCALNKIDLLESDIVLHLIKDISEKYKFDEIFPLSAYKNFNVSELLHTLIKYLPEHEFYYDSDTVAAQTERFFVSELIRQEVLKLYSEEIPFSVFVDIEEFKERASGKDYIRAAIIIEKDSQKKIIIGSKGNMIKRLGARSRKEIEQFLNKDIFLELFVKVKKNWKNDEDFLRRKFKQGTSAE